MNARSRKFRFAAAALFAATSVAGAADFTFNVPVSLKSITPENATGVLNCTVYNVVPPAAVGTVPPGANYIGSGNKSFTLTKGAYEGTITIAANAAAGKTPADAKGYICALGVGGFNCNAPGASAQVPCRNATAAGNSVEVKGEIKP